jgi:hypothetical protein
MFKKTLSLTVIFCFFLTTLGPLPKAHADTVLGLPAPGTMVNLSSAYEPTLIKGLIVHKDNPFLFDFIVDTGHSGLAGDALKKEGDRLVKYFFACLTIPEKDLWVNLSPYEKDRMVPQALGQTGLGRDLLAQDYILKQLTASLIYPEKDLGKSFWDRVYAKAQQMYGTTQIPVNTFNKVWIVADKASVYEHGQTAFVVSGHMKVMLEEDYLALTKHQSQPGDMALAVSPSTLPSDSGLNVKATQRQPGHALASQIVRQIILPEIEKEVNTGKNFATLRQIFNSLILASWYKKNLKEALLTQVYANKSTVKGVNLADPSVKQQIYQQYLKAYKKGVFNYIKEDAQPDGQTISRKYFSGGFDSALVVTVDPRPKDVSVTGKLEKFDVASSVNGAPVASPAMTTPDVAMTAVPDEGGRLPHFLDELNENFRAYLESAAQKRSLPLQSQTYIKYLISEVLVDMNNLFAGNPDVLKQLVTDSTSGMVGRFKRAEANATNILKKHLEGPDEALGKQLNALVDTIDQLGAAMTVSSVHVYHDYGELLKAISGALKERSALFDITTTRSSSPIRLLVSDMDETWISGYEVGEDGAVKSNQGRVQIYRREFIQAQEADAAMLARLGFQTRNAVKPRATRSKFGNIQFGEDIQTKAPELEMTGKVYSSIQAMFEALGEKPSPRPWFTITIPAGTISTKPIRVQVSNISPKSTSITGLGEDGKQVKVTKDEFISSQADAAMVTKQVPFNKVGENLNPENIFYVHGIEWGPGATASLARIFYNGKLVAGHFLINERGIVETKGMPLGEGWKQFVEINKIAFKPSEPMFMAIEEGAVRIHGPEIAGMKSTLDAAMMIPGVDYARQFREQGHLARLNEQSEKSSLRERLLEGIKQPKGAEDGVVADWIAKYEAASNGLSLYESEELADQELVVSIVIDEHGKYGVKSQRQALKYFSLPQVQNLPIFVEQKAALWEKMQVALRTAWQSEDQELRQEAKEQMRLFQLWGYGKMEGSSVFQALSQEMEPDAAMTGKDAAMLEIVRDKNAYVLPDLEREISNLGLARGTVKGEIVTLQALPHPGAGQREKINKLTTLLWVIDVAWMNDRERRRAIIAPVHADHAQFGQVEDRTKGGIDLNTSNGMQWKISKDGKGVEMNIDPAMIARIRREGIDSLSPVILRMTPVASIWPLMGLQAPVK